MMGQHIAPFSFMADHDATSEVDFEALYGTHVRFLEVIDAGGGTLRLNWVYGVQRGSLVGLKKSTYTVSNGDKFLGFIKQIESVSDVTKVRIGF